jgi:hypothetical protein
MRERGTRRDEEKRERGEARARKTSRQKKSREHQIALQAGPTHNTEQTRNKEE